MIPLDLIALAGGLWLFVCAAETLLSRAVPSWRAAREAAQQTK